MELELKIESVEAFLLIAAVVALLARRLRLPYTVGLLLAGIAVAFTPWNPHLEVTKELVFALFLPPLVFEAAFALHWDELKRDMAPLLGMATLGVVLSTAVVFLGFTGLLGWDWRAALMFSTLISATDPVGVIAMLKEARVTGRFRLLIEAESLFNDGTAAAIFAVALVAVGTGIGTGEALFTFAKIAVGGLACGGAVGAFAIWLMGRTDDHLVEITCTVLAAYGAFLLAEHFGFSGVLGTVVAGLMVGNIGPLGALTAKGRDDAETFWEFCAFVVNSLIFLLMGLRIAETNYLPIAGVAGAAVLLVTLGRAVAVYGVMALFFRSKHRLDVRSQHLLVWGGMRGALALALALGLPKSLPMHDEVLAVTFAVVAFSTVVQGITMVPLIARHKTLTESPADSTP
ncbi:sodium:proton antiporter [bacterium]|nr:MAG: sodium:proton antiporter [bacterium]